MATEEKGIKVRIKDEVPNVKFLCLLCDRDTSPVTPFPTPILVDLK